MRLIPLSSYLVFSGAVSLLVAGCISVSRPGYLNVDRDTPEFKLAVADETQRQQEKGVTAGKAEKIAEQKVTQQIIRSERQRRSEQVIPLVQALTAFDRPRGCWAYTVTTTTRKAGTVSVVVETYDAFQPEERLWTLVSRDGQPPDEKAQTAYREKKLRAWKKQLKKGPSKYSKTEQAKLRATASEMEITPAGPAGQTTFTFTTGGGHISLIGDIPSLRITHTIDAASSTVTGETQTLMKPFSGLAGAVKMESWASTSEYALIEPTAPPFPIRTTFQFHGVFFGKDTGLVEGEAIYSNYHRVKCYDDRFEVKIGEPSMSDFMPGSD